MLLRLRLCAPLPERLHGSRNRLTDGAGLGLRSRDGAHRRRPRRPRRRLPARAGAVGAGGLGDVAIRYGYQRFDTTVMLAVIAILIALVCLVQFAGDTAVRRLRAR